MTTNNHPANGPVSLDRLHQIRETLSKASAQSDGGNLGYAMADAVKVIDGVIAAFGAEPVSDRDEFSLDYLQGHKDGLEWAAQLAEANHPQTGDWLYDDPIELAGAIRKGPDMPPVQTASVVDADDNFYSWFGREWEKYYQPNNYSLSAKKHLGAIAESAWFACRSAMLQAGNFREIPDSSTNNCREISETSTNSPALSPIDHGYRPDCECSGCIATARICAELAVSSQAVPDCWCRTCRPVTMNDMRFVVCPDCGNKRCPRANDHRNACTGSNELGQEGSAYPAAPQQEVK